MLGWPARSVYQEMLRLPALGGSGGGGLGTQVREAEHMWPAVQHSPSQETRGGGQMG